MKNLTYIFLAGLLFMLGCGPASDSVDNPKAAVYYWRTSLTLDSVERQFLSDHNVGKMYVRYFDITLDENQHPPCSSSTTALSMASTPLLRCSSNACCR